MNPINVLYVFGDKLRHGGIENFMMNYFRHIDKNIIHIDFAVQGYAKGAFDEEIEKSGSCIYRLPKPGQHFFQYKKEFCKILASNKYKIIHAHCDAMNFRILRLAKKYNIPIRISHSHNTQHILSGKSKLKAIYYEYSIKRIVKYATVCYACSWDAGKWLYGNHKFRIIPNAIDIDKFLFRSESRSQFREKYAISKETIVLGHVGRFDVQKNQMFLLDLLENLVKAGDRKYILLMVGDGWMKNAIRRSVLNRGLEENVIFTGEVVNPQDYYNMMDIFLIPSLYEGYCIALEEAEVNGLPCIASKDIPKEVDVLKRITYLPLKVNIWMSNLLEFFPIKRYRGAAEELKLKGYDIHDAAKKLQNEYVRLYQESVNEKRCTKYQS